MKSACQEQVASAGRQKWDYCAPKVNYAEVGRGVWFAGFCSAALICGVVLCFFDAWIVGSLGLGVWLHFLDHACVLA